VVGFRGGCLLDEPLAASLLRADDATADRADSRPDHGAAGVAAKHLTGCRACGGTHTGTGQAGILLLSAGAERKGGCTDNEGHANSHVSPLSSVAARRLDEAASGPQRNQRTMTGAACC
jgi:hypothetical protein